MTDGQMIQRRMYKPFVYTFCLYLTPYKCKIDQNSRTPEHVGIDSEQAITSVKVGYQESHHIRNTYAKGTLSTTPHLSDPTGLSSLNL